MTRARRLMLLMSGALALGGGNGCSVPLDANSSFDGCESDAECVTGAEVCHRGFCVGAACEGDATLDCYSWAAPDGGTPIIRPVCRAGVRACVGGTFGPCLGQVLPGIETCNGLNDDCDAEVDEQPEASCDTGEEGLCSVGMPACLGSEVVCRRMDNPRPEVCDGDDNDCDGDTDEDADVPCFPRGARGCSEVPAGSGRFQCAGLCHTGVAACDAGAAASCSGFVVAQAGDGCTPIGTLAVDDDCDGSVDEDCAACGAAATTQSCYVGPTGTMGVGACRAGTQTCQGNGRWSPCDGTGPAPESCANLSTGDDAAADDDCNGVTDDIPLRGEPCDGAGLGRCALGARDCVEGSLACVSQPAIAELCNGIDDDCNGPVDNGFDLLGDEANCGVCGQSCAAGLACCNGSCVNTATDATNCGTCGSWAGEGLSCCGGESADLRNDPMNCGACGRTCGAGRACCDGVCTDTGRDALHCGSCDDSCSSGQACCQSACRAPSSELCQGCAQDCEALGQVCCMGACVDTDEDTASCGACGRTCEPGDLCCDGTCVPDDAAHCGSCGNVCAPGDLCCNGTCVPDDELNCGACGDVCGSGQACCDGDCVGVQNNDAACGRCDNPCTGGKSCSGGVCCGAGLTGCGGACVDTDTTEAHCGACNDVCNGNCVGGKCCFLVLCS